ncbi:MAG: hypothetical protein PWP60_864 [Candidatus Atribacteria bacterium]|jgi:HEPN domain-containing protein|nr:hypothetical protein [Candidatus Atribacteria bacterium]
MKRNLVLRWLRKAENDLASAEILLGAGSRVTDVICFHCQQAIEKYLKAFLTDREVRFGKVHDLRTLLDLCIQKDQDFEELDKESLSELTFYAVDVRYPDEFYMPSLEEAKGAFESAKKIRGLVFKKLGVGEKEL